MFEQNIQQPLVPELFCFGLLELVDLKDLVALVAPRPVSFVSPSDRVKIEMADLHTWYRFLGRDHDPLAP